jgi:dipeptidyl aminopeptidase/acylaminoacyl peptidase
VYGAKFLVEKGLVDPSKMTITGGSAGGFTALASLVFDKTFAACASYYGVSDLEALVSETHKFEAHYLEGLVGPYPEKRTTYRERSPLHHVNRITAPVIFFQGLEDKVVPSTQAKKMHEALKKGKVFSDLVIYKGEQHGFRKEETIRDALEKELAFYLKVFYS